MTAAVFGVLGGVVGAGAIGALANASPSILAANTNLLVPAMDGPVIQDEVTQHRAL